MNILDLQIRSCKRIKVGISFLSTFARDMALENSVEETNKQYIILMLYKLHGLHII